MSLDKIPGRVREEAVRAIRKGNNLEAVEKANKYADAINNESFYEKQIRQRMKEPYELI